MHSRGAYILHRVLMKSLHGITAVDALKRYWHFFWAPVWVSLILGLASKFSSERTQTILFNAVSGQLALTLVKLLLYVALFLLGMAVILKGTPYLATFLRWSGARIADVTFDYTSCAVGVVVGLTPLSVIELGFYKGIALSGIIIMILFGLQSCLWVASNLAYGHFDANFQRSVPFPNVFVRIVGAALIAISVITVLNETWNEVPQVKELTPKITNDTNSQ